MEQVKTVCPAEDEELGKLDTIEKINQWYQIHIWSKLEDGGNVSQITIETEDND